MVFSAAGFWALSIRFYLPGEIVAVCGLSALAYWWGLQWGAAGQGGPLQPALFGTGMALLAGSLLAYTGWSSLLPIEVLAAAVVSAGTLSGILRGRGGKTLLVGFGPLAPSLAGEMGRRLLGVVGPVPDQTTSLGGYAALPEILEKHPPGAILVDRSALNQQALLRLLLECKMRGIAVGSDVDAWERVFQRVSLRHLEPHRLLWSEILRANRPVMAVQAVYSNLAGLFLLVCLSPLLLVLALATRLEAGPGPLLETVEYAGFQDIPFYLRRFRTRHLSGRRTFTGRLVEGLRLTRLPQVLNVVRGDMVLFGPAPVRRTFADYLDKLSPIYSRRLAIKPGIFSWAAVHRLPYGPGDPQIQEEHLRMAYDLYYFENSSWLLDIEILARSAWPFRRRAARDKAPSREA